MSPARDNPPPLKGSLTVRQAIWRGLWEVNGPVFALLLGPLAFFSLLIDRGIISRDYNWVGLASFPVGFVCAWCWWSWRVPLWRLWAYERVDDIAALKVEAVAVGLTWPKGHRFSKTEFKSKQQAAREQELDPDEDSA